MTKEEFAKIRELLDHFAFNDPIRDIEIWGNGLINKTYRVYGEGGRDYLLQQVNTDNYPNIDGVMHNIRLVTDYIANYEFFTSAGLRKDPLRLIPLWDGRDYYRGEDGACYRLYNFLKDTYCIETCDDAEHAYKAGLVLGQFHFLLQDIDTSLLTVVVPDYHNVRKRYELLLAAADENRVGRLADAEEEMAFFRSIEEDYAFFNRLFFESGFKVRVNHNDTKINNIMFDADSKDPLCMVDLDTIMPGYAAFDFGDAIRSIMCTGREHGKETQTDAEWFQEELYEVYRRGFLAGACGAPDPSYRKDGGNCCLSQAEIDSLWDGAKMIVLENAIRYLTDYLQGDCYFHVRYPSQNLIKTRMHISLYRSMKERR